MKFKKFPRGVRYLFLLFALACLVTGIITLNGEWFIRTAIFLVATLVIIYLNKRKK